MNNVFVIPSQNNKHIVYLPLQGILFEGNASVVNLFFKALQGDSAAQSKFGLNEAQVRNISNSNLSSSVETKKCIFKPTSVSLFITSECSMRCVYCYANAGSRFSAIKHGYVKVAIAAVIQNALDYGKKEITVNFHGGGDIGVVWKLVKELTTYIQKQTNEKGLNTIFTAGLNGILNQQQKQWVVENLRSATISLDGTEKIQNMLRPLKNGHPSFHLVNETLEYFDSKGFNYAIRSTVTAESLDKFEESIRFLCERYSVKKIKAEPVFLQGRAIKSNVNIPDPHDFVEHFLRAKEIADSCNKELLYSGLRFEVLNKIFCQAAGSSFGVTPEGYITSCYEVLSMSDPASKTFFYGQIIDDQIKIDNEKLKALYNMTVLDREKCKDCFAKFHCAGDCPVKAMISDKDDKLYNYRCTINRELTRHQIIKALG